MSDSDCLSRETSCKHTDCDSGPGVEIDRAAAKKFRDMGRRQWLEFYYRIEGTVELVA